MSESRTRSRWVTGILVVVIVVGGLATAIVVTRKPTAKKAAAASIFQTVAVSAGNLTTDEDLTGSVVLDNVTQVLHRIAGQTTSLTPTNVSSGSGSTGSTGGTGSTGSNRTGTTVAAAVAAANALSPTRTSFPGGGGGGGFPSTTTVSCNATPPSSTPFTFPSTTHPHGGGGGGFPSTTTSGGSSTTVAGPPPFTTPPGTTTTTVPTGTTVPGTTTTTQPSPTTTCPPTSSTTPSSTPGGGSRPSGGGTGGTGAGGTRTGSTGTGGTGGSSSSSRVTQVVTSVLGLNASVRLGAVLYTVESQPVVAMAGALPAWRTLAAGITDGPDIAQLKLSLVGLGYDRDHTLTIDDHWDANTTAAVERWQAGYGYPVTGSVTLGQIVFLSSATTVASVTVKVGDAIGDGDQVMTLAAPSQQVLINVASADQSIIVPGLKVGIGDVTGTVTRLTTTVQSGTATVVAIITPESTIKGAQNGSTVTVHVTQSNMKNVLVVPAGALASRIDGTYAVQVVAADGTTTWRTVTVLGISGPNVAIRGDGLSNGTKVLQPL